MNSDLKKFYEKIRNKRVTVLGIGVSNRPLIQMLVKHGARVTACDKSDAEHLGSLYENLSDLGVEMCLGPNYLSAIDADIIFKTPGMRIDLPELKEAADRGIEITSEMEVFFDLCPCKIVAVTGSDGKSTTTTLISEMLKAQGYTVHLGGNIGRPLLPIIDEIMPDDFAVVELSSFQLHTMKKSPDVAVVTNVTPNHLDMHKSMEEYISAKENILKYQDGNGLLVVNYDNDITRGFGASGRGRVLYFSSRQRVENGAFYENGMLFISKNGKAEPVLNRVQIALPGDHNVENYMAAILAVLDFVKMDAVEKVAEGFKGIAHRLEFVRELEGVKYYNDSIASSPTRTIAGLHSFEQKLILIAGGYDKKIPFDILGEEVNDHVKCLLLIGNTAEKIYTSVVKAQNFKEGRLPIIKCESLAAAVKIAKKNAHEGDIVVLSPACASFDSFKNFEERGNAFKNAVNML